MEAFEELEFIEKYLRQQLNEKELAAFEKWRRDDAGAEKKIRDLRAMQIGIQEYQLEQELKALRPFLDKQHKKSRWPLYWAAASVAIVFLTWGIWRYTRPQTNQELFEQYYKPDPGLATFMGLTDKTSFDEGMLSYKTGSYSEAISTWKPLRDGDPQNDTLNYFLGAAYMANKQYENGEDYFAIVIADSLSVFKQDAIWYQSLLFIEEGNVIEAKKLLKTSTNPSADKLLLKLMQKHETP